MSIDIGGLAQAIVNALLQGLTNLISPLPQQFLLWLSDQLNGLWDGVWNSGADLFNTPIELTLNYPPARDLGVALIIVMYSITSLSAVLLGLRALWRSLRGGTGTLDDTLNGFLMSVLLAGGSVILIGQAYALTWQATQAIGRFSYTPDFEPRQITDLGPAFIVSLFTILVMFIYGFKLMLRAAYRIALLMFLTPFAPVAGILYGIPQTRWIASAYYVTLGGWLAGGVLAIGCVSLGVQIAANEHGGLLPLFFGVALIQLAYDLMVIIPAWKLGTISIPQIGIPNVLAAAAGAVAGGAGAAGAGAVAGGGAAGAMGATMVGAGTIGALPVPAMGPSY